MEDPDKDEEWRESRCESGREGREEELEVVAVVVAGADGFCLGNKYTYGYWMKSKHPVGLGSIRCWKKKSERKTRNFI